MQKPVAYLGGKSPIIIFTASVHLSHAALADLLDDFVMGNGLADHRLLPPQGAMELLSILNL
jgi:hypothetical protein